MQMKFVITNYSGEKILENIICLRDTAACQEIKLAVDYFHDVWNNAIKDLHSAHFTNEKFTIFYDYFSFDIPENVVMNSVLQIVVQKGCYFTFNDV